MFARYFPYNKLEKEWYSEAWKPFLPFTIVFIILVLLRVDILVMVLFAIIGFTVCSVITLLLMRQNDAFEEYAEEKASEKTYD